MAGVLVVVLLARTKSPGAIMLAPLDEKASERGLDKKTRSVTEDSITVASIAMNSPCAEFNDRRLLCRAGLPYLVHFQHSPHEGGQVLLHRVEYRMRSTRPTSPHAPPTATPIIPPVPSTLVEAEAGDADDATAVGVVVTVVLVTLVA